MFIQTSGVWVNVHFLNSGVWVNVHFFIFSEFHHAEPPSKDSEEPVNSFVDISDPQKDQAPLMKKNACQDNIINLSKSQHEFHRLFRLAVLKPGKDQATKVRNVFCLVKLLLTLY